MENKQRALNYLGLARRGGRLVYGEETVGSACRAGHARLLVLASDTAPGTFRRANSYIQGRNIPMRLLPFTKDELGAAIGCSSCAIAVLTDVSLAQAFVQALGEPERDEALLAELGRRVERVQKRRQEEKAHQKNLRKGGKKHPASREK